MRELHQTGQTIRWHINPVLARVTQTTADHSWGVAVIIIKLHPKPSMNLVKAALFHDSGEKKAGDLPYDFKRRFPEISKAHAQAEEVLASEAGVPELDLSPLEAQWLKFADRLEAYYFVRTFAPEQLLINGWPEALVWFDEQKELLGITDDIFA